MRLGFEAKKIVSNLTGIGNYSRNIINALSTSYPEHGYVLFAPDKGREECLRDLNSSTDISFVYPSAHSSLGKEWWRCKGVVKDIAAREIDIFHGLSNELPWGIDRIACKSVVTIHDLIFLRHPEFYSFLSRQILKAKTRYACEHADRIIAISNQTKQDIVEFYQIPDAKIDVVYQGCNRIFRNRASEDMRQKTRVKYRLPSRYILCVGTLEPRKNQLSLVRALPMLGEKIHLVLISKKTPYQALLEEEAGRLGVYEQVHILNQVPNEDLPAIYQGCTLFAYLSLFEGFGIPVLEAITSGVPVIAGTGSCLEEAGGPGAIYCAPENLTQIVEAINRLLINPDEVSRMVEAGLKYADQFTEPVVTGQLWSVYHRVL